jgi:hypothetical protein
MDPDFASELDEEAGELDEEADEPDEEADELDTEYRSAFKSNESG